MFRQYVIEAIPILIAIPYSALTTVYVSRTVGIGWAKDIGNYSPAAIDPL